MKVVLDESGFGMKVVLDESGFGMKVVLDENFWDEKRQVHPNLDETVPNRFADDTNMVHRENLAADRRTTLVHPGKWQHLRAMREKSRRTKAEEARTNIRRQTPAGNQDDEKKNKSGMKLKESQAKRTRQHCDMGVVHRSSWLLDLGRRVKRETLVSVSEKGAKVVACSPCSSPEAQPDEKDEGQRCQGHSHRLSFARL